MSVHDYWDDASIYICCFCKHSMYVILKKAAYKHWWGFNIVFNSSFSIKLFISCNRCLTVRPRRSLQVSKNVRRSFSRSFLKKNKKSTSVQQWLLSNNHKLSILMEWNNNLHAWVFKSGKTSKCQVHQLYKIHSGGVEREHYFLPQFLQRSEITTSRYTYIITWC